MNEGIYQQLCGFMGCDDNHYIVWQEKIMESDSISRKYLNVLLIIAVIAECFAIAIFIMLTAFGYIGFDGGSPVTTPTCTQTYFTTKYAQISVSIQVSYLCSLFSLVAFSVVLALLIKCVCRASHSTQSNIFIAKCIKIALYISTCIAIISSIPTLGYYLNFLVELNGCTTTYDNVKVALVFAFSILYFCLLLAFLILLLIFLNKSVDPNYGQVERTSTEPVEPAQEPKYANKKHLEKQEAPRRQPQVYERTPQEVSRSSPPKKINDNAQQMENTKQNLYKNSPSRQPTINIYSKRKEPSEENKAFEKKQNPPRQIPPVLEPRSYQKQPFMSNSRQHPPSKEGELIFSKARKNNEDNEDYFSKQQSRFMSNYAGRPILAYNSGLEEPIRPNNKGKEYFRQEDQPLPRKNMQYSPTRKVREGGLLNYIRGKYAN